MEPAFAQSQLGMSSWQRLHSGVSKQRALSVEATSGVLPQSQQRVSVLFSHGPGHDSPGHPECEARGPAAERGATSVPEEYLHLLSDSTRVASLSEASSCHDERYLDWLSKLAEKEQRGQIDMSTYFCGSASLNAALVATAAAKDLSDVVMHSCKPAFAVTRPPGHHAIANESMGFCLTNHVAIAAKHLQQQYEQINRVAILDPDVHAGNGTEAAFWEVCALLSLLF